MTSAQKEELLVTVTVHLFLLWPCALCVACLLATAFLPETNKGVITLGLFATASYFLAGWWFLLWANGYAWGAAGANWHDLRTWHGVFLALLVLAWGWAQRRLKKEADLADLGATRP